MCLWLWLVRSVILNVYFYFFDLGSVTSPQMRRAGSGLEAGRRMLFSSLGWNPVHWVAQIQALLWLTRIGSRGE